MNNSRGQPIFSTVIEIEFICSTGKMTGNQSRLSLN